MLGLRTEKLKDSFLLEHPIFIENTCTLTRSSVCVLGGGHF